jgi:tetratricopeptide (TPR) repeat protein
LESLIPQRKLARADSVFARWSAVLPGSPFRLGSGVSLAFAKRDYVLAERYADSLIARGIPGGARVGHLLKSEIFRTQGRLADAEREDLRAMALYFEAGDKAEAFKIATEWADDERVFRGHPDVAVRRVDSVLVAHPLESVPPADRPYLPLAEFYVQAGKPERAERLVAEYDRLVPADIRKGDFDRTFTAGLLSLAGGKPLDALARFRESREHVSCAVCTLFQTARAFEGMQQADSARDAYEELVTTPPLGPTETQFTLAQALRRLGELYEAKGNKEKALEYYGRFVELWKSADPELQPVVQDVRKRMVALGVGDVRR